MPNKSDLELVRQVLNGKNQAFEMLVVKYQKPIFNAAFRMVQNSDDAEEIAQSAFVKAYEKLSSYNEKYKFFSWLYRIAINETLNFISKRKNKDSLDTEMVSRESSPEDLYSHSERSQNLQIALGELKSEYRAVIVLKHLQELSYQEISEILDVPVKTVKSHLFTARQQLREVLLKRGIQFGG